MLFLKANLVILVITISTSVHQTNAGNQPEGGNGHKANRSKRHFTSFHPVFPHRNSVFKRAFQNGNPSLPLTRKFLPGSSNDKQNNGNPLFSSTRKFCSRQSINAHNNEHRSLRLTNKFLHVPSNNAQNNGNPSTLLFQKSFYGRNNGNPLSPVITQQFSYGQPNDRWNNGNFPFSSTHKFSSKPFINAHNNGNLSFPLTNIFLYGPSNNAPNDGKLSRPLFQNLGPYNNFRQNTGEVLSPLQTQLFSHGPSNNRQNNGYPGAFVRNPLLGSAKPLYDGSLGHIKTQIGFNRRKENFKIKHNAAEMGRNQHYNSSEFQNPIQSKNSENTRLQNHTMQSAHAFNSLPFFYTPTNFNTKNPLYYQNFAQKANVAKSENVANQLVYNVPISFVHIPNTVGDVQVNKKGTFLDKSVSNSNLDVVKKHENLVQIPQRIHDVYPSFTLLPKFYINQVFNQQTKRIIPENIQNINKKTDLSEAFKENYEVSQKSTKANNSSAIVSFKVLPKFYINHVFNPQTMQIIPEYIQNINKKTDLSEVFKENYEVSEKSTKANNSSTIVSFKVLPKFYLNHVFNPQIIPEYIQNINKKTDLSEAFKENYEVSQKTTKTDNSSTINVSFKVLPNFYKSTVFEGANNKFIKKPLKQNDEKYSVKQRFKDVPNFSKETVTQKSLNNIKDIEILNPNPSLMHSFKVLPNFHKSAIFEKNVQEHSSTNQDNQSFRHVIPNVVIQEPDKNVLNFDSHKASKHSEPTTVLNYSFKILPDFNKYTIFQNPKDRAIEKSYNQNSVESTQQIVDQTVQTTGNKNDNTNVANKNINQLPNLSKTHNFKVTNNTGATHSNNSQTQKVFNQKENFNILPNFEKTSNFTKYDLGDADQVKIRDSNSDSLPTRGDSFPSLDHIGDFKTQTIFEKNDNSNVKYQFDFNKIPDTFDRNKYNSTPPTFITLSQNIQKYDEGDFSDIVYLNSKSSRSNTVNGGISPSSPINLEIPGLAESQLEYNNRQKVGTPKSDKKVLVKVFKRPVHRNNI